MTRSDDLFSGARFSVLVVLIVALASGLLRGQSDRVFEAALGEARKLVTINQELQDELPWEVSSSRLVVGTFDARSGEFSWHCGLARVDVIETAITREPLGDVRHEPDCRASRDDVVIDRPDDIVVGGGAAWPPVAIGPVDVGEFDLPPRAPETVVVETRYEARVEAPLVEIEIRMRNNIEGVVVTFADEVELAAPGVSVFRTARSLAGSVSFRLQAVAGPFFEVPETRRTHTTLFKVDTPACGGRVGTGYFVIPALPAAIVYQPPWDTPQQTTVERNQGVSVTKILSKSEEETVEIKHFGLDTMRDYAGLLKLAIAIDSGPAGVEIIDKIGAVLDALTPLSEEQERSQATISVTEEGTGTVDVKMSTRSSYVSVAELGPGAGDYVLYLRDVLFVWTGCGDDFRVSPVAYRRTVSLEAAVLADDPIRDNLLDLDPQWTDSSTLLDPDRFVLLDTYENAGSLSSRKELMYTFEETHRTASASLGTTIVTEDPQGMAAFLGGEANIEGRTTMELAVATGYTDRDSRRAPTTIPPRTTAEVYYDVILGSFLLKKVRQSESLFIRGDANGDERLDISDGRFILDYLFLGGDAPTCFAAMDSNDDEKTNLADATALLGFLFLGNDPLPTPGPTPGPDPTPGLPCR